MKRLLMLSVVALAMAVSAVPAAAQGNYIPMDPATLPQVPGCGWYPDPQYAGMYQMWCGSDALGWYRPFEWYQLTGIWPPDYGLQGG